MLYNRLEYYDNAAQAAHEIYTMLEEQIAIVQANNLALYHLRSTFREEIYYQLCRRQPTASSLRYNTEWDFNKEIEVHTPKENIQAGHACAEYSYDTDPSNWNIHLM